ncbi:MAG: apolipoprotein N-acyltransferase [Planctomycetota bacterium]
MQQSRDERAAPISPCRYARAFVAGLLHAALLGLAFPPMGWWPAAFVAPVPLFWIACRSRGSGFRAGFWAMLGVAPFWVYTHAWVASVSAAGVYPLVLYLSAYTWAFVVLVRRCLRARLPRSSVLVVVWCGLEFFRAAIGWSGYAWYMLGHPMIDSPDSVLAWPASIGGVPLVSALVALPGAVWVTRARAGSAWGMAPTVLTCGLLITWIGWGGLRPASSTHGGMRPLRVGIVQTNVPQDNRIDWTTAQRLDDWLGIREQTRSLAVTDPAPELIVWPEGLVPGWTFDPVSLDRERKSGVVWVIQPDSDDQAQRISEYPARTPASRVADEILEEQRRLGIPMLVGSVAFDDLRIERGDAGIEYNRGAMYNSVFLVRDGRVGDLWYDKIRLTPFGEIMPYISAWPWLEDRLLSIGAAGMSFALAPGRSWKTLPLGRARGGDVVLATPICFEATTPSVCRRLVRQATRDGSPTVMINVSNDGWFARSDRGRRMHAHAARWRCVELGVPMVRVANTGVSGAIDGRGRVLLEMPARQADEAVVAVDPAFSGTLYSRFGEWAGWGSLGLLGVLCWMGRARKSRSMVDRPEETEGEEPA